MENKVRQHKRIKILILMAMLLLVCIPAGGKFIHKHQIYPITENRERAQRPWLMEAWKAFVDTGEYCSAFEDWFNDNFQLRDLLIRTKNQIQYTLFDLASGVYVDAEGYLYYQSVVAAEQIYNEQMTDEDIAEIESLLMEMKEKTESLGAEFYCMFPPQKSTVFTEQATTLPVQRPTPNRYDYWRALLGESKFGSSFIDVLPTLQEADKRYPTYYKTDFHWNSHGATVAFAELVNQIAGEIIYSEESFSVEYGGWFQGGQLNNFSTLTQQGEAVIYTNKNSAVTMEDRSSESAFGPVSCYLYNTAEAPLGKILLVGDSYTLFLLQANSGVLDCFSEVYYINMNNVDYSNLLSRIETGMFDYILFEKIECGMYNYEQIMKTLLGK